MKRKGVIPLVEMKKLFIFNPDCELAIANGSKYYMPPANIRQMMEDLAFLPAWMGSEGDYVLVGQLPDEKFIGEVCRPLNLAVEAVTEEEVNSRSDLRGEPWGLSPKMCYWLAQRGMGGEWKPEQKEMYSRKLAREGLEKLLKAMLLPTTDILPQICYSVEEIRDQVSGGYYLVKAPWSSSGKGLLALNGCVGGKEQEWLSGMFRRQGYLMLEKRLDKVKDFAMEFKGGPEGISFIGWSDFKVGGKGEYRGNYIGSQENVRKELLSYLNIQCLEQLKEAMINMLQGLLSGYNGYFGIDMMIYRDMDGNYCLHPCVEINLRYNMGIIALFLSQRYLAPKTEGMFEVCYFSGKGEAFQEHLRLRQEFPVIYENNRIKSGYLNLTPVDEATHFIASVNCY